ncbi:MAG: hypothetical protein ACYC4K_00340 [Thiobacillus sp.]
MKRGSILAGLLLLTACGSSGPPVPDWKSDSVDFVERYKKHALLGENTLAERYFQQALRATGGAGRLSETGRLWLVHCATRRASLLDDDCSEYVDLAKMETSAEDQAYYQFVTLNWSGLDASKLPAQYAGLVKADAARISTQIATIEDPLSRLLAASLVTLRGQADNVTLNLAMETASTQGWRQPLLTYLKLLEKSAIERGATSEQQTYALRIRLIEEALRKPTTKPPADPIK